MRINISPFLTLDQRRDGNKAGRGCQYINFEGIDRVRVDMNFRYCYNFSNNILEPRFI